jgi:hypothetical protein
MVRKFSKILKNSPKIEFSSDFDDFFTGDRGNNGIHGGGTLLVTSSPSSTPNTPSVEESPTNDEGVCGRRSVLGGNRTHFARRAMEQNRVRALPTVGFRCGLDPI